MTELAKRCAIYTRKSFEPPIGQEFTSLESQRAICSSYVRSQQHRGWTESAAHYDDSGQTGADTLRPALQQMLGDVEAGLIDVVLVYKLDRLTRTLIDFVRLMDFMERHGVALVSITQNFDTSDSLGRLILNVLLTFAQFEREILSDRMKDRIRVLKQMGRWVGGSPPIGYDVIDSKLIPNRKEAAGVRNMFETYLRCESSEEVHRSALESGFRRKVWKAKTGRVSGGGPITLSSVYHILRNPIYIGKIRHREDVYEGIHRPIVDCLLFEAVQAKLAERGKARPRVATNLLTGVLYDAAGRPMCIKTMNYRGIITRYYASNVSAWARRQKLKRMRANAKELEDVVVASLKTLMGDREQVRDLLLRHGTHGQALDYLVPRGSIAAKRLDNFESKRMGQVLQALLQRVEVTADALTLVIWIEELRRYLEWDGVGVFGADAGLRKRNGSVHLLRVAVSVIRSTKLYALPIEAAHSHEPCHPEPRLNALLDDAERARQLVNKRRDLGIPGLAQNFGCTMNRFTRLVRLTYLAPDIQIAIRDGRQPDSLNRLTLIRADIPLDWATQRVLLGFPAQPAHFRNSAKSVETGSSISQH